MRRPFEPDPGHAGEGTGMLQDFSPIRDIAHADVIGAGIAGTWQALALAKAGLDVTVYERDDAAMRERLPRAGDAGADDVGVRDIAYR